MAGPSEHAGTSMLGPWFLCMQQSDGLEHGPKHARASMLGACFCAVRQSKGLEHGWGWRAWPPEHAGGMFLCVHTK